MEPTPESATEPTAPPGCRSEPPYQRPDTRLRIVLSYWLIFFLGLPFWWRATSIERLALPRAKVEQISHLKDEIRIPVSLDLTSEVSGLDLPGLVSRVEATFAKNDAINDALKLSFSYGSSVADGLQNCETSSNHCLGLNDRYSVKIVPDTSSHVIEDRALQVPFDLSSPNYVQDLSNTLAQLLLPPTTDAYKLRVAQYAPRYRLAFSLLNEDASVGGGATGWDIEEALARE
ncbi:GPI transamidase component [Tulasnella sp. 427]|nr:GPI transamidase component [Tulasnella sp. 427]